MDQDKKQEWFQELRLAQLAENLVAEAGQVERPYEDGNVFLPVTLLPRPPAPARLWPNLGLGAALRSLEPNWVPPTIAPALIVPKEADRMLNPSLLEGEAQAARLEEVKGYTIAIEATWYLNGLLDTPPVKEPLLSALGGLPYWLSVEIEDDLDQWERHGLTPLFIFDGISIIGKEEMSLRAAKDAARRSDAAWALYRNAVSKEQTTEAVTAFGNSCSVRAESLYRFFQEILYERGLKYEIATHSAAAYMAHLDKHPIRKDGSQACEAIMGSYELLLYDIDHSVVTKIDFAQGLFFAIVKATLLQKLNVSEETFINALLMVGTSFLPTFPALKDRDIIKQQPFTIIDAINMFRTANKSMTQLCDTFSDVLQREEPTWEDKFRKAKMAIKHNIHVVDAAPVSNGETVSNGGYVAKILVNKFKELTGDHHEYIGLALPDEFFHYLIHGCIGPRILNWLAFLELLVYPPLYGGGSEEYRRLVTKQLIPIQAQTIALYTSRLHRAFQHKNFTIRFWFDYDTTVVINHQNITPAPDKLVAGWRIEQKAFDGQIATTHTKPGSFSFALMTLENKDFVKATSATVTKNQNIKSQSEVMANTMWRLLQLRGYITRNEHTVWGKGLTTALKCLNSSYQSKDTKELNPPHELEEAAFLAFELLQLDQLNARNRHEEWIGAPRRGSDDDKTHVLLIARCSCLVKLRHKKIGYTGPLSQNLLAYHSIISAVRNTDRDLVEAIVASMFAFAHADRRMTRDDNSTRERKRHNSDWAKLGFSLPFGRDVDIGLGIAVKTYLDEHSVPGSTKEEKHAAMANYVTSQLPESEDFPGDLEIAYNFFEAIAAGVKSLGSEIPDADRKVWEGAVEYLASRR